MEVDSRYAVTRGDSGSKVHFLLVPTDRITGIECPRIWASSATDYWAAAAMKVHTYFPGRGADVGLGINSKYRRNQDQLHIHMAAFAPDALKYLKANDKEISSDPGKWKGTVLPVNGHDSSQTRNYRVMRVENFANNLFALLRHKVLTTDSEMENQMMVLIPRSSGYYVLNSDNYLRGGTDTCDHLMDVT
ncbi:CDP-diacylglycerol diphosphatase [Streptomyces sp. SD15]